LKAHNLSYRVCYKTFQNDRPIKFSAWYLFLKVIVFLKQQNIDQKIPPSILLPLKNLKKQKQLLHQTKQIGTTG
jgi:hypothetical protein